jgi:MYXO-CTERM domain-containing protein
MRRTICALLLIGAASGGAAADDCHSNLMIVLDRSCSMQDPPSPGGTRSKWQIAGEALMKLTTKYAGMVNLGLIMFPDQTGMACVQDGHIALNVGPSNEDALVSRVTGTKPNGPCVTPIKPGVDQVSTDPAFAAAYTGVGPRSFVLFISDGEQTCGGNNSMIAGSFAALYAKGFPSYIVGFGGAVSPAALDQYATAGGVPRLLSGDGGGPLYYRADDAAALDAALDEIVGTVVSAEFASCNGPPCPDHRCFAPGQQCVSGSCIAPPGGDGGSRADGGGSDGAIGGASPSMPGCGCHLGGVAPAPSAIGAAAVLGLLLCRRRRFKGTRS